MWEKLEKVDLKNKEIYLELFKNLINQVTSGDYDFKDKEKKYHYIINETNDKGKFVHIIPRELLILFNEMKKYHPDEFLGFTILVNDVRVSCFGIPCSELSKAIIN